ncbi:hypothetical protein AV530_011811 [Patagioenas fasciata monilis]|uniref:Uncharacterized protein n=1 Tax=Patagioenas fasciata monilis TaxID=372326 RepID=A0A1V4KLQ8_PATFA|nr:hypothetical protein AV530_011811 [Patagioenas fasciata monilis]
MSLRFPLPPPRHCSWTHQPFFLPVVGCCKAWLTTEAAAFLSRAVVVRGCCPSEEHRPHPPPAHPALLPQVLIPWTWLDCVLAPSS